MAVLVLAILSIFAFSCHLFKKVNELEKDLDNAYNGLTELTRNFAEFLKYEHTKK